MSKLRCLDVTRLISRQGRGPLTGVDRVELAYLRALIADPVPLYLLVRTWLGFLILDQSGAEAVLARLEGRTRWGAVDAFGHLQRKAHPMKRRAEADLRRLAVARAPKAQLRRALRRVFTGPVTYINVGHSNLSEAVLGAWAGLEDARVAVLVHDMIPLDFPQMQRPGTVESFEARMRRVARYADQVICISAATEARVRHWFGIWGRVPPIQVAHIGVDLPVPGALPDGVAPNRPYFTCIGTIEPRKNHALLLDIWEELAKEPKAPALVIAGARGWNNEAVFARLDAKPALVTEARGLDDGALAALLRGSRGLLFPTLAEGFGLPPAEALSLGVPTLCSDLPVLREILGKSSIYAPVDDMYLWKQSILRLAGQGEADTRGEARAAGQFERPDWGAHFNLVLKVM